MSINKTPYKLEVWEDVWVTDATYEIGGYINEVRSVIIGADDMDYDGQAYDIVLTRDIFGTVTLKFSINGSFINTKTGERETNYLTPYLFNEVKLKLAYPYDSTGIDTTWYDFIIKEVSDAKGDKFTIEYNCKFLPQHELAKTGWDIAFDMERSNAIQTAPDFIEAILDNTEWSYQASADVDLVEYAEEALYIFDAVSSVTLSRIEINFTNYTYNNYADGAKITATGSIYIPYSEINSSETYIQVFYVGSEALLIDNHYVIINEDCRYWMHKSAIVSSLVATKYRGKKIKNNHLMEYINYVDKEEHDNDINQYCYVYKDSLDNTFYSYDYYTNNDTSIAYNQVPAGSTRQPGVTYYTKTTSSGVDYYTTYTGEDVVGKYVVDTVDAENIVNTETTITRSTKYFSVIRDALNRITTVTIITDNGVITGLIPQYTIEKYRAIEKKESNRFNLIQTVAETFEVWSKAIIGHDANGRITYTDAAGTNGIIRTYDKNITLVTNYGQENPIGFTYGINIRGIKRQVDSNSVTTKLFVKPSENDTAKNGICSIQTADENLAAEIFLFNFDYFIQMGLINEQNLIYDLYNMDDTGGQELGYLRQLGILNQEYDMIIDIILNSGNQSLATQLSIAQEKAFYYKIAYQTDGSQENYDNWKKYESDTAAINDKIIAYNLRLEAITEEKRELTRVFNAKYIRFIQEGTWGESNYTDANIYYFDALKVLAKASKPNISYNIEVIDLSPLIGYEDYKFEIGDETFIEDTEYFGFESTGVPYREQVIVSEQSNTLDNPTKNTIKIQNYYTQFEDLFKRLTSTVESYELNKNIYARASNLDTNGAVIYQSLQTSFLENKDLTLSDSETVKVDNTGITVIDAENSSNIVRIVSGGIVLSDDGGVTYKTGIYGGKINTALLSAGVINSEEINIRSTFDLGMIEMTANQIRMYAHPILEEGQDPEDYINYEVTISPTNGISIKRTEEGTLEDIFYVDTTGSAYFKGNVTASGGFIGGFTITATSIYKDKATLTSSTAGVYLGTDGISLGGATNYFKVTSAGALTATSANITGVITATSGSFTGSITASSGTIGGFTIASNSIYTTNKTSLDSTTVGIYIGTDGISLGNGGNSFFKVTSGGVLTATKGTFSGTLNAATGTFAGSLSSGVSISSPVINGGSITATTIDIGSGVFQVNAAGALTASSATISGSITATSGTIGGFTIAASSIYNGKTTLDSTTQGIYIGTSGIHIGNSTNSFKATAAGTLTLAGGTISGGIFKSTGTGSGTTSAYYVYDNATQKGYLSWDTISASGSGVYLVSNGGVALRIYSGASLRLDSANGITIAGNVIFSGGTVTGLPATTAVFG